jgi:predicted DNA binding CopG/RHH family protein
MSKRERGSIDRILDEAAADAEAAEDGRDVEIPAHVKVTRGGPRTRVLQVRLNDDELAALEKLAEERGLPASTVVREMILNALDPAPAQAAARQRLMGEFGQYLDASFGAGGAAAALVGKPPVVRSKAPARRGRLRRTPKRRGE